MLGLYVEEIFSEEQFLAFIKRKLKGKSAEEVVEQPAEEAEPPMIEVEPTIEEVPKAIQTESPIPCPSLQTSSELPTSFAQEEQQQTATLLADQKG